MKNKLFFAIAFVLVLAGASAQAQLKVGYTNMDYLLTQVPEHKQIESELKTYQSQLENQLQAKYKEFQTKADDYKNTVANMSEIIKQDKEKELQNMQTSIQEFEKNADASLQKKRQTLLAPVIEKIQKTIKDVAKENGYTYVFNTDAGYQTTPIILSAPEEDNISNLVLKKMGVTPIPANANTTSTATPANKTTPANNNTTPKKK